MSNLKEVKGYFRGNLGILVDVRVRLPCRRIFDSLLMKKTDFIAFIGANNFIIKCLQRKYVELNKT